MLGLAFAYMRDRRLATALSIVLLALGVGALTILLLASTQLADRLARNADGIDLVVGAKGSPLQLILSSIYQMDQPTGNIPLESIALLRRDPAVAEVVPLALGDNFSGYRIVGTERSYLALYKAEIGEGRIFVEHGEAVLGADVAAELGAGLGQRFVGSHGLSDGEGGGEHHAHPFITVGILKPTGTVIDRLILTSIETVWDVHGIAHHDTAEDEHAANGHGAHHAASSELADGPAELEPEVTALLVRYRSAAGAVRLPSLINRQTDMQAAVPAIETARLLSLLGVGIDAARLFAGLLAAVGGLSIFVMLLYAASAREGDLALLRVMGASRERVFGTILAEGLATALIGGLLGLLLGHAALAAAIRGFSPLGELGLRPWDLHPGEAALLGAVIAIGLIAAFIPALRVFRTDLASTLARIN